MGGVRKMTEYIERESIITHMKDLPTWRADSGGVYGNAMKYPDGMFDCEDVISSLECEPAADVVPVVRCKDCKYRVEHHYEEKGEEPYIKYSCKFTNYSMSDNGFCSFGARMDGDE